MKDDDIIQEFKAANAIMHGHFILSSGLHSDTYIQCERVMVDPKRGERLANALAQRVKKKHPELEFDMVLAPAMGGVRIGYEMARQMDLPGIFCERVDGRFTLRRGFAIPNDARILVVEDVVTTGKSSLEAFACARQHGGEVVAEACLVDRSGGEADLGVPLISLLKVEVATYTPDAVPDDLKAIEAVKPGSRMLGITANSQG